MNDFRVGDWVYGEIVEIDQDREVVYVEFETYGGGGCLPFGFDELVLDSGRRVKNTSYYGT